MKFSRLLLSLGMLTALAGCAYIIPPDQNLPRNNIVLGEPHRPELNNGSMSGTTGKPQSALTPSRPVQEVAQNPVPALPPVDDATQARAQQEMAQAAPQPVAPVSMAPASNRRVPAENAPFVVSANDTNSYPSLMNVPPRPVLSGPDSAKERLSAVQSDLTQDRANAQASKDALARDAAAEPSILAPMPQTSAIPSSAPTATLPAPATVTIPAREAVRQPGANAAPLNMPPQATIDFKPLPPVAAVPPRAEMPINTNTPNTPSFAPPAPMTMAATPAPRAATPPPIALMRPPGNTAASIASQDLPAPNAAPMTMPASTGRPTVSKGDFDPLAAADNAPILSAPAAATPSGTPTTYASDGYLAASRYAAVRRY